MLNSARLASVEPGSVQRTRHPLILLLALSIAQRVPREVAVRWSRLRTFKMFCCCRVTVKFLARQRESFEATVNVSPGSRDAN